MRTEENSTRSGNNISIVNGQPGREIKPVMKRVAKEVNRREFLKRACSVVASASVSAYVLGSAAGESLAEEKARVVDPYDFLLARFKFDSDRHVGWNVTPGGERNLLEEFSRVIRCQVKLPPDCRDYNPTFGQESQFNGVVDGTDMKAMRQYPCLFMTAEGGYTLKGAAKKNIERYLREGGFLLMDDCVADPHGDLFYQSSRTLLEELFGPGAVQPVPTDHEIFHNVYDLGQMGLPYLGWGKDHGAQGIFLGDRLAVFLSSTDIHCGWVDRPGLSFGRISRRGGKPGYEEAIQIGINIIMYVLSH